MTLDASETRTEQAARLLAEVVREILSGAPDLIAVLRKGYHACVLAGWSEGQAWFQRELEGYPKGSELPWYRRGIRGKTIWAAASIYDVAAHVADRTVYGEHEAPEVAEMDCWHGMASVLDWARSGLKEPTGERRTRSSGRDTYHEEKREVYPAGPFLVIADTVQNEAFKFASAGYTALTYGDALQSVWEGYRAQVDPVLTQLGLGKHLETIRDGIRSENQQAWRNAMWACRDVLHDLAACLWRDPRPVYERMKVKGKPLDVDESSYINRLLAYLHFKGQTDKVGKYLGAELERINSSIHTLYELDSKAHAPVTRQDARLAAIATYLLLGEFIQRTDMQPVENWGPSAGEKSGRKRKPSGA
jgi:hypothetical protein